MGRKSLKPIDWSSSKYFACPFVSHEDIEEFYCILCDSRISGNKDFYNHINSSSHETKVLCCGCYITPFEDDLYKCSACDCVIPTYTKVYNHIHAKGHRTKTYYLEKLENERKRNFEEAKVNDKNSNNFVKSKTNEIINKENNLSAYNSISKTGDSKKVEINESLDQNYKNGSAMNTFEEVVSYHFGNNTNSTQESGVVANPFMLTLSKNVADSDTVQNFTTIKTYNQRFIDHMDFQKDFYDLRERTREWKYGIELCLESKSGKIYCLICRKIVPNKYENYDVHLRSGNHCKYLEEILNNGGNAGWKNTFSELNLAKQYMICVSEAIVHCLVCHIQVHYIEFAIQIHIDSDTHREKWEENRSKMNRGFEIISSRLECNWYKIQKFSCIFCSAKFDNEINFAEHLKSEKHGAAVKAAKTMERALMYDFCEVCALFWCGNRDTYANHCDSGLHKWYRRNNGYVSAELPDSARQFLARYGIQNEDSIDRIDYICVRKEINNKILVAHLEHRLKKIFPCIQVCAFGSRITSHCVIDVFLGCEKMSDGRTLTEDQILYFMTTVNNWLGKDPISWNLKSLLTGGKSPIITAHHIPTGLTCDISFDNGLVIGGTTFINLFDDIFPSCCKLMHYLSQWLAHCELTGSQHISSYALYWYLIFYLQKESILPSVAALTNETEMQIIHGHQVFGTDDFANKTHCNVSLKNLVIGFFKFYANFDFRHEVACPLVGDVVKKHSFAYPEDLPIEMGFYVAYVKYSNNPEEFPIDLPMCIQDPFNLNHNLSKTVSKVDLSNFRTYCAKTADCLCSS